TEAAPPAHGGDPPPPIRYLADGHPARRADYCLTYGRPADAGGTERPITPATAISVRTYGSAWKRTDAFPQGCASRNDSAVEPPKSNAAAKAPNGRQLPKITAA